MVPIGIVTRDRVAYLDVTLRSLSATSLPTDVSLTVYDDHSSTDIARWYYDTTAPVPVATDWPTSKAWRDSGLNIISDNPCIPTGIRGLVDVNILGVESSGVVNASCEAICDLFDAHPAAPGVILLQDDVIFKPDWYRQLLSTVERAASFTSLPLGVLAGLKLNQRLSLNGAWPVAVSSGITAQCLYISRRGYDRCAAYFQKRHKSTKCFDDTLRKVMAANKLWAGCIYPFVCQHFGIQSLVRPGKKWTHSRRGRIGYYVHPPYALADAVRQFSCDEG